MKGMPGSPGSHPSLGRGRAINSVLPTPGAEERFQGLVEQIPAVVYIDALDEFGTTVYISPQVAGLLGYPLETWEQNPGIWFEAAHPDDRDAVFSEYLRRRDVGEPWSMEYRMITRDGSVIWIREDDRILNSEDGHPVAVQGVMYDVTEQKATEARYLELDRAKNALLRAVSHDLKSPISAILNGAKLIMNPGFDISEKDRETLLGGIVTSVEKMDRLVSNLIDLERLERGIVEARSERFDLGALVRAVQAEVAVHDRRRVRLDVPEHPIMATGDPVMLERIVENLLMNALKHTDDGAAVALRLRREDGEIVIAVEDSGDGVPPDLRETIFRPFDRGMIPDGPGGPAGLGIGLSLVAKLTELHGGRAWVQERVGGGASFRVSIPDGEPSRSPETR
jgi:PAS domain S-box-containing protein